MKCLNTTGGGPFGRVAGAVGRKRRYARRTRSDINIRLMGVATVALLEQLVDVLICE